MSLNLIIGKSNSGKSEYIMKKIMACSDKQAILFVPSSMRVIAEQEYLKYTDKKGIVDVNITSIERFVDKNVNKNELFKSKEYLPELAKKLLIRKVILENQELFKIFAKVKNNTNFIDKLCSYVDSAKNQRLSPSEILDKYDEKDFLREKLQEFANIYTKVDETLNEKFVSSLDSLEYYILQIGKDNNFKDYEIFFDGYNNFSKVEYEYIKALLLSGANVTITLEIDLEKHLDGSTEIFNTTYETIENLRNVAAEVGTKYIETNLKELKQNRPKDLEFLATNIFDLSKKTYDGEVKNVELILKENTYSELEYIAADISKRVREGYRYKDIVIYTNDIDLYATGIKRIFSMYNIETYYNSSSDISSSNLIMYAILMLKLASDGLKKDITPVVSLLKTDLVNLENVGKENISKEDVQEFENYVNEFGIKGYMLENKFTLNNKDNKNVEYDLDKINKVRECIVNSIYDLKTRLNNSSKTKDITQGIYDHLIEREIVKSYEETLNIVRKESVNEYNKKTQILNKLYEIMDNICIAYDELTIKEYIELLEYAVKEIEIDTIPEKIDQVYIADINKNRGNERKIGYIIGAYDGGLPTIQNEDNIFSDAELAKLKNRNIDLKQSRTDRNNMQLFNIYQAINKVREHLVITVPSSKMAGGSLRPSSLIQNVKNILDIKLVAAPTATDVNLNANFMNYITRLTDINELTSKEELEELYNEYLIYKSDAKYNSVLEYLRTDNKLKEDTLNDIYKDKVMSSVSKLEEFKRCPFKYYSKYILNLRENKEYEVSTLDMGSLMHEVIEHISKYLIAKNIAWHEINLNEKYTALCDKEIDNVIEDVFKEKMSKYLVTARYVVLKNKLKSSMKKTIHLIADSFNHSEFRPLGYEIAFEDGALFAPIKIELDNGKAIFLRGKIDRVDSLKLNGNTYLRIVDYKSSDRDLKLSDVKDGINLQLMTYMWAMIENKEKIAKEEKVIPAAVSYFTISGKLLNIPIFEKDEKKIATLLKKALKLKGIYIKDTEVLESLDNNYKDSSESYLGVSTRTFNNEEKVLPENTFIEECKNMSNILKEIASDMLSGNVSISPNKKVKEVCKYCKFNTLCRKDILN